MSRFILMTRAMQPLRLLRLSSLILGRQMGITTGGLMHPRMQEPLNGDILFQVIMNNRADIGRRHLAVPGIVRHHPDRWP